MPYFWLTLETGSMSSCPYVVIALKQLKSSLTLTLKPRRWFQRQREAFLTITPEERKLVDGSVNSQAGDKTPKGVDAAPSER
jgi:hypothetical protein